MNRRLCLMLVPLMACSGSAIRGGVTVPAEQLPSGESIASYVPSGCTDATGAPAQWSTELRLIRSASSEDVLVELRPDQDALVIPRAAVPGQERVFQVVVQEWLREIRLPATTAGTGTMVVARHWEESSDESGVAATRLSDVVVQCSLVPPAPSGPEATPNQPDGATVAGPARELQSRPAPEPSGEQPDPRTGY